MFTCPGYCPGAFPVLREAVAKGNCHGGLAFRTRLGICCLGLRGGFLERLIRPFQGLVKLAVVGDGLGKVGEQLVVALCLDKKVDIFVLLFRKSVFFQKLPDRFDGGILCGEGLANCSESFSFGFGVESAGVRCGHAGL